MRNGRFTVSITVVMSMLFVLMGCATPKHSNTLIFGTNTKFALDVSADTSGSPGITVGYKRQEAVWMPLLANVDEKGKPADCKDEKCLFTGTTGSQTEKDTYSVLASFGATFSGDTTGGAKAGGGLAQYFATGLAARKLAEAGPKIVSVQPENELPQEIKEAAIRQLAKEHLDIDRILDFVNSEGNVDGARLKKLIANTGLNDAWADNFTGKKIKDLRDELEGPSRRSVPAIVKNIKE